MNEEEKNKIIELQTLLSQKSHLNENDPAVIALKEKQAKLRGGKSKEEYSPVWYYEDEDDKHKVSIKHYVSYREFDSQRLSTTL